MGVRDRLRTLRTGPGYCATTGSVVISRMPSIVDCGHEETVEGVLVDLAIDWPWQQRARRQWPCRHNRWPTGLDAGAAGRRENRCVQART